ncbi:hypothetical protein TNCV_1945131 [Trichonephila clavipes]|nr:hypothetical protein TNCV_1945131 [Trichonephila clavipes]
MYGTIRCVIVWCFLPKFRNMGHMNNDAFRKAAVSLISGLALSLSQNIRKVISAPVTERMANIEKNSQGDGSTKEIHLGTRLDAIVVLIFRVFNPQCISAELADSLKKIAIKIHA